MKKLNFYKYVYQGGKEREFMRGVYHKDGFKFATDGKVAIKIKSDYPEEFEDKIISKEQTVIDGRFPNVAKVIPDMEDMREITDVSPNATLIKEYKALLPVFKVQKKLCEYDYEISGYCLPNGSFVMMLVWEQVIRFLESFPDSKLYCHKEDSSCRKAEHSSLMLISGENLMVFMPAVYTSEKTLGYNFSTSKLPEKDYEGFIDYDKILYGVCKVNPENLTDKDSELIKNLNQFIRITGLKRKEEGAA